MRAGGSTIRFGTAALFSALGLLLAGCETAGNSSLSSPSLDPAPANVGATAPAQDATSTAAYRLGPGDKVSINVFGEADLSGEFLVGDDGRVDLPLIGAVQATGQSVNEFQTAVVARYSSGYLKDPKVSISVLNYRPFFITGEVGKGGEYPFKAGLTIQDAVAIAGGYTYRANTGKAFVRRAGADQEVPVELTQRVTLNPGDIVRIPERFF